MNDESTPDLMEGGNFQFSLRAIQKFLLWDQFSFLLILIVFKTNGSGFHKESVCEKI